jgi:hypothetical protein
MMWSVSAEAPIQVNFHSLIDPIGGALIPRSVSRYKREESLATDAVHRLTDERQPTLTLASGHLGGD